MPLFKKDSESPEETLIAITERALSKALAVRDEEPDAAELALFVEVLEPAGLEYSYDLYFDKAQLAKPGDHIETHDALTVVVPQNSVDALRGAKMDLSRNLLNPGWIIENPNRPATPAVGTSIDPSELSGEVPERVQQVLDRVVNPAIASHGGGANLVAVEGDTAYLQLSGGCQGCGMATVTLSQGIEVAITDAVPEITHVVDVTDHAAGTNPYYEPAKK